MLKAVSMSQASNASGTASCVVLYVTHQLPDTSSSRLSCALLSLPEQGMLT